LILVIAAEGKNLVLSNGFEIENFPQMLNVLGSVVLGTGLILNLVSSWTVIFGMNPIYFLKIARILLANFSITTNDVSY
jgi:hypothetical protein